ncbi:cell division protein FtsL [Salinimonas iocasae]|mgnify:FL=1|uniref:Cell division protein FtsL n=1 Tax=Salinimonas iocasae TaxID=2572577 RepID=A0A5B7YB82_9ALTE|nr:cell division protein FtsL [Salinimonas iocasae]QCZ92760.1 cell division protein FtsL [Salinimonas iocasae]|tara:strand:- start:62 stop:397 length:336 start_codon:yes stop_codon:yes gene_type:complete
MSSERQDAPEGQLHLAYLLLAELTRNKLRVLLYLMVIASAFAVILSSHHNRQQNIALEKLMQERDELDVQWRNLVLEQRALTEHNRIEAMVEKQLDMHRPGAKEEVVVRIK